MLIPRFWERTRGEAQDPGGKRYALLMWGWSQESVSDALGVAERRLRETVARITSGDSGSGDYAYGRNPLREEIVREIGEGNRAIITRNRYGALILNTATFAFIDIDTKGSPGGLSKLLGFFGRNSADQALDRIREACAANNRYSYRIYRTRRGFRLLVTTPSLDPKSPATEALLKGFGADPAFIALCRIQGSFRARLSPKPWRVDCPSPPGQHPRDAGAARDFDLWRARYEAASKAFATCQFVEEIGAARPSAETRGLVELHDRETRAVSGLPLA